MSLGHLAVDFPRLLDLLSFLAALIFYVLIGVFGLLLIWISLMSGQPTRRRWTRRTSGGYPASDRYVSELRSPKGGNE